jgi:formate dehydrogenase major subunit
MIVADMNVPFGDSSCISCGTCLQVCPTGALMDRRSAYRGLEKQVEYTKSTCTACSLGCGIKIVSRDNQLLRIEADWDDAMGSVLCVAGRFDILDEARKRVTKPMVRRNGALEAASWDEALDAVAAEFKSMGAASLAAFASSRASNEALNLFADVFSKLGASSVGDLTSVPDYMSTAEGSLSVLDEADFYIVVGADLRVDHQVAGIMIQRSLMNRGARLAVIDDGPNGMDEMTVFKFGSGELDKAIGLAEHAEIPVVVYGPEAGDLLPQLRAALGGKAQFVGLVPGSNTRGALAAGLNGAALDGAKGVYVMSVDDTVDAALLEELADAQFVVAQTSYLDALTERANVVLPTTIWAEKSCTTTNTEGKVQTLAAAVMPPAGVKQDEEILNALAEKLG